MNFYCICCIFKVLLFTVTRSSCSIETNCLPVRNGGVNRPTHLFGKPLISVRKYKLVKIPNNTTVQSFMLNYPQSIRYFVLPQCKSVRIDSDIYAVRLSSQYLNVNLYNLKMAIKLGTKKYFLYLDTNNFLNSLHFPFAARFALMLMINEGRSAVLVFNEFALLTNCILKISEFAYEKSGFIHCMANNSCRNMQEHDSKAVLVEYFIPAFVAFIQENENSTITPLLPYVKSIISKCCSFHFYRKPLESLQQLFLTKFGISIADILSASQETYPTSSLGINLAIIHVAYCHLQPLQDDASPLLNSSLPPNLENITFFQLLWKEIVESNDALRLFRQFYTTKFVDILNGILDTDVWNVESAREHLQSFNKLISYCPNCKFTCIFISTVQMGVLINKVCDILSEFSSHELFKFTNPKVYVSFLKYFQQFIHFFMKVSVHYCLKKWKTDIDGFDEFAKNILSLEPFINKLIVLQHLKDDVLRVSFFGFLKTIQHIQLPSLEDNELTVEGTIHSQSVNSHFYKQPEDSKETQSNITDTIEELKLIFSKSRDCYGNTSNYVNDFSLLVDHFYKKPAEYMEIFDLPNYSKTIFVLEMILKIKEKNSSDWTRSDRECLKNCSTLFGFVFSDWYVKNLFENVKEVAVMKKLLIILLRHHQCLQKTLISTFNAQRFEHLH